MSFIRRKTKDNMFQDQEKYNLLYITSLPPTHSAGLVQAKLDALISRGHNVDCITVYDYEGKKNNIIALFPQIDQLPPSYIRKFFILPFKWFVCRMGIYNSIKKIKDEFVKHKKSRLNKKKSDILFLYPDEEIPPISPKLIVSKINKQYDAVITGFWEGMINSTSLKAIYDKLHCPIIIGSPDMAPMTGGCYYFGKCRNFYNGCGYCEALGSTDCDDKSHRNYLTKKKNYDSIDCAFIGNTWMNKFAEKSKLFKNIFLSEVMIDESRFCEGDRNSARLSLGAAGEFIIMIASSSQPRKGNRDIAEAVLKFHSNLSSKEQASIELLIVGDDYIEKIFEQSKINICKQGRVDIDKLAMCYQASDLFISASNDDAGPSMVNQAIMSGTPVVCYNNGTAIDVIENMVSGYKVNPGDKKGLTKGIEAIYNLSAMEYAELRKSCREIAIRHNSTDVCISNLLSIISKLKQ